MNNIRILSLANAKFTLCILCDGELTADQALCQGDDGNTYAHWTCVLDQFPNPYPITHVVGNEEV